MKRRGPKYRTLGKGLCDGGCGRCVVVEGDEVRSIGEVGVKPAKCSSFDSGVAESGEQDGLAYSIEGCTQVKEDEEVEGTRVGRDEEVI